MDFERRSAIEYLSLQNAERTHAEMLAWLMSDSSLLGVQRLSLLRGLLGDAAFEGINEASAWTLARPRTEVTTEDKRRKAVTKERRIRLDVVLELSRGGNRHAVAFEYKMKSTQSLQQLAKYDDAIARLHRDLPKERIRKVLLTFDGAKPESGDGTWLARSFDDLLRELAMLDASHDRAAAVYLDDYRRMLTRLIACRDAVLADAHAAAALLGRKPAASTGALATMRDYVDEMKIGHLLHKAWLDAVFTRAQELLAPLAYPCFRIQAGGNVQNGDAILNVYLAELTAPDDVTKYRHGLQVQFDAFKAFVEPYPDREVQDVELPWTTAILSALGQEVVASRGEWALPLATPVSAGEGGFRSKTLTWLEVDGERVHRETFKTDFDVERRAQAVAHALRRIRATTPASDFPGFAWIDLTTTTT